MKFLNKKSAFIAALIGVVFFWRKKKSKAGGRDRLTGNLLSLGVRRRAIRLALDRPN